MILFFFFLHTSLAACASKHFSNSYTSPLEVGREINTSGIVNLLGPPLSPVSPVVKWRLLGGTSESFKGHRDQHFLEGLV